jgi:hypothetical protein
MGEKKVKLRPIVYASNSFKGGHQNTAQQMLLLKALQVTQDPKKLREMIGVKTVAQVYQTLDKLVMRREYHQTLANLGISFDFIAGGIKSLALSADKDDVKLKAFMALLKSVGMDKYDNDSSSSSGTWEETLLKRIEEGKKEPAVPQLAASAQYEVKQPDIPESARKSQEEESEMTSSVYESTKRTAD